MKKTFLIFSCFMFAGLRMAAQITVEESGDITLGRGLYFGSGIFYTSSNFYMKPYNAPYPVFQMLYSNGNIGIAKGPTYPQYCLDIGSTIRVNTTIYTSDLNLKTNIRNISPERITGLKSLNAVIYRFDESIINTGMNETDPAYKRDHFGLIAQDVQKVYPEIVYTDSLGVMSVDYIGLIPLLLESVKSLTNEVDRLKEQINALEAKGN